MDFPAYVLVWTCVVLFILTAIITLGGLVGWFRLGGGAGDRHDYYLRNLFRALVVEIVAVVVGLFDLYIKNQLDQTQSATRTSLVQLQKNLQDRVTNVEDSIRSIRDQIISLHP